jgi:hypothetical protein
MANDNPFDPKYSYGLLRFLDTIPPEKPTNALADWMPPATTPGASGLPERVNDFETVLFGI